MILDKSKNHDILLGERFNRFLLECNYFQDIKYSLNIGSTGNGYRPHRVWNSTINAANNNFDLKRICQDT
jgi:hypothetical protein